MSKKYKKTKEFWETIFAKVPGYNPLNQLDNNRIENAIQWISESSKKVLEFGTGNGRVISRCLYYGVENIYGIDISTKGIEIANSIMKENNLTESAKFNSGSVKSLKKYKNNEFDGIILFNIIDNLYPSDVEFILKESYRILNKSGKVLIKLNQYLDKIFFEKNDKYTEISNDFYEESSGIYFWNISNEKLRELINPYFKISKNEDVVFENKNIKNRLFFLIKNNK